MVLHRRRAVRAAGCDPYAGAAPHRAGLANPLDWRSIAYKGGSEPGVLNLSTYVTTADGTSHCVVATWNNDASFYDGLLTSPYRGLLRALAGGPVD
jgi:hypothetical protein